MIKLRQKYEQSDNSFRQAKEFEDYNVEILQHYIDQADWEGAKIYNNTIITELDDEVSEAERTPLVESFTKDLRQFLPSFQEETKGAFERAFSVAEKKPEVKALFHGFSTTDSHGKGRCMLNLCREYEPTSLEWVGDKLKKGHPRFKLPHMTVNVFDYTKLGEVNIEDRKLLLSMTILSVLFNQYLENAISLALCMVLHDIPNRNIPVGMKRIGSDIYYRYISYL